MPNRILRDYTDSLCFDGIGAEVERLFIRLLTKADDYGRFTPMSGWSARPASRWSRTSNPSRSPNGLMSLNDAASSYATTPRESIAFQ